MRSKGGRSPTTWLFRRERRFPEIRSASRSMGVREANASTAAGDALPPCRLLETAAKRSRPARAGYIYMPWRPVQSLGRDHLPLALPTSEVQHPQAVARPADYRGEIGETGDEDDRGPRGEIAGG